MDGTPPTASNSPADPFAHVDREAFARDLDALRARLDALRSVEDLTHLKRMARWGRLCTAGGYATGWIAPNPVSAALLSLGATARWTIVAHHVMHRALDKVPEAPEALTSRGFARGRRRLIDWCDWLLPAAWEHEHNVLHHHRTNELADPDLVEENATTLRGASLPRAVKYASMAFYALTWKYTYYAPSTFQVLQRASHRRAGGAVNTADAATHDARGPESFLGAYDLRTAQGRAFWRACVLPYAGSRFVLAPLAFAPLGPWAVASVLTNSLVAEGLTNLHTFVIIAPNHAGEDLYRFDRPAHGRGERYLRQVVSSVNFRTGGDLNDFLHGFLNYQIEHHVWPDLSPRQYRIARPQVREICEKHGVPYVQEGVLSRVAKLARVWVGAASMRQG